MSAPGAKEPKSPLTTILIAVVAVLVVLVAGLGFYIMRLRARAMSGYQVLLNDHE